MYLSQGTRRRDEQIYSSHNLTFRQAHWVTSGRITHSQLAYPMPGRNAARQNSSRKLAHTIINSKQKQAETVEG